MSEESETSIPRVSADNEALDEIRSAIQSAFGKMKKLKPTNDPIDNADLPEFGNALCQFCRKVSLAFDSNMWKRESGAFAPGAMLPSFPTWLAAVISCSSTTAQQYTRISRIAAPLEGSMWTTLMTHHPELRSLRALTRLTEADQRRLVDKFRHPVSMVPPPNVPTQASVTMVPMQSSVSMPQMVMPMMQPQMVQQHPMYMQMMQQPQITQHPPVQSSSQSQPQSLLQKRKEIPLPVVDSHFDDFAYRNLKPRDDRFSAFKRVLPRENLPSPAELEATSPPAPVPIMLPPPRFVPFQSEPVLIQPPPYMMSQPVSMPMYGYPQGYQPYYESPQGRR